MSFARRTTPVAPEAAVPEELADHASLIQTGQKPSSSMHVRVSLRNERSGHLRVTKHIFTSTSKEETGPKSSTTGKKQIAL